MTREGARSVAAPSTQTARAMMRACWLGCGDDRRRRRARMSATELLRRTRMSIEYYAGVHSPLANQSRSAWSFDVQLRSFRERW